MKKGERRGGMTNKQKAKIRGKEIFPEATSRLWDPRVLSALRS